MATDTVTLAANVIQGSALEDGAIIVVKFSDGDPHKQAYYVRALDRLAASYKEQFGKTVHVVCTDKNAKVGFLQRNQAPAAQSTAYQNPGRLWIELLEGDAVCLESWGSFGVDESVNDPDKHVVQVYRWRSDDEFQALDITGELSIDEATAVYDMLIGGIVLGARIITRRQIDEIIQAQRAERKINEELAAMLSGITSSSPAEASVNQRPGGCKCGAGQ